MKNCFKESTIDECVVLDLDKHYFEEGSISVIENNKIVPYEVKRIFFLYDVPSGQERGGHAHYALYQLIVSASGSFDVTIDDGKNKRIVSLNRPNKGLLVVPGIWNSLNNFSSGAISLVLASELFDESDYLREYDNFVKEKYSDE